MSKKPTEKSKWNTIKYSNNPKEGRKRGKKNEVDKQKTN